MTYTLSEFAAEIDAQLHLKGHAETRIRGLAPLENSSATQISFLANPRYKMHLTTTKAAAVILAQDLLEACPVPALVVKDPYVAFARAAQLFDNSPAAMPGVHPSAVIDPAVIVPSTCSIGPFVVIEVGVTLGEQVVIGAGSVIGAHSRIGAGTVLKPRVVLYHSVIVGKNCLIHSGAVIGSDGFGLANDKGRWLKIPQLGSVELQDEVEIGANTTIDRGALENTLIKAGVKIDNQVQIAHNVVIGEGTAIAAQAGIAGSSQIGKGCLLGGKAGVTGHVKLGDGVMIAAMSGVSKDLALPGVYSSNLHVRPLLEWNKFIARMNRVEKLIGKKKNESNT